MNSIMKANKSELVKLQEMNKVGFMTESKGNMLRLIFVDILYTSQCTVFSSFTLHGLNILMNSVQSLS